MEGSLQRRKKSFLKTYHTRYKFISLAYIWFILLSLVKYLVKATMEDSLTRIDLIGHVVNIEEQGGTNCMIFLRNYKFCYRNLNHKSSTSVCHIAHKSSGHCRISMRLPKICWRPIWTCMVLKPLSTAIAISLGKSYSILCIHMIAVAGGFLQTN